MPKPALLNVSEIAKVSHDENRSKLKAMSRLMTYLLARVVKIVRIDLVQNMKMELDLDLNVERLIL